MEELLVEILTSVSVMIEPEADHVNTSICPGVSNMAYLSYTEQPSESQERLTDLHP